MGVPVILYPVGLAGADFHFPAVADCLGMKVRKYAAGSINGPGSVARLLEDRISVALLVLPTSVPVDRTLIEQIGGQVQCLASASTGTDHVDLQALAAAGIDFLHSPGANARSVIEYVLSALAGLDSIGDLLRGDLTVGIVGYGRIGGGLGTVFAALGIPFSCYDPFVQTSHSTTLSEVLSRQVVTFHVPLTADGPHPTRSMIGESLVEAFRPDAVVLNTARGGIVSAGAFAGLTTRCTCIMDVFPNEPPSHAQVATPFLVSPHVAGYNYQARLAGSRMVAQAFLERSGEATVLADPPEPDYEISVVDFLPTESRLLKQLPASFARRRSNYPSRGDFAAHCRRGSGRISSVARTIQRGLEAL